MIRIGWPRRCSSVVSHNISPHCKLVDTTPDPNTELIIKKEVNYDMLVAFKIPIPYQEPLPKTYNMTGFCNAK